MAHVVADRILETSTTAGTGAVALDGAVTGFRRFSAKMAINDTCWYVIYAVDLVGRPTGEFEWGIGTYTAANQLTRTTVVGSSNADGAVAFAAGAKQVALTIVAPTTTTLKAQWRKMLDLDQVANVAPADMPVSTAQQAALDLKPDTSKTVTKTSATGQAQLPAGLTSQRGNADEGVIRFNKETKRPEWGDGTRFNQVGGATGGGNDTVFYMASPNITEDFVVPAGQNALALGFNLTPGKRFEMSPGSRLIIL